MDIQQNQWSEDLTLDEVEILFASEALSGNAPSVAELIALYPQWTEQITTFALDFQALQKAHGQQNDTGVVPITLQAHLAGRLAASREPARTLNDARKALGWTPDDLAQKLNLPTRLVVTLSRGLIQDWPRRLEWKLSAVLMRPMEHIEGLLRNSVVTPATNFSAQGSIGAPKLQSQSFRAALEECERTQELTSDQKAEWLAD